MPLATTKQGGSMFSATSRFKALVAAAALLLTTAPVLAGQYVLEKGKGVGVCEAYQKVLNISEPTEHMLCERKINPDFKEFRNPEWLAVDVQSNKQLLWSVYSTFYPNVEKPASSTISNEAIDSLVTKWINPRAMELYKAKADINNDGHVEDILMYKDGVCGIAQYAYATVLLVQQDSKPQVDRNKTDLLQQNTWKDPKTGEVKRDVDYYLFNMYGLFQYKNVTYFDRTDARAKERGMLHIYKILKNRTEHLCEYRFVGFHLLEEDHGENNHWMQGGRMKSVPYNFYRREVL